VLHGGNIIVRYRKLFHWILLTGLAIAPARGRADTLDLYVDEATKQVYTEPGANRTKLGTFRQVEPPGTPAKPGPAATAQDRLHTLEDKVGEVEKKVELIKDTTSPSAVHEALKGKWYERLSLRGYTQFRYNLLADRDDGEAEWFHPADRSIGEHQSFLIRRARLILSGDVTNHLFLYVQPDLNAAPFDGDFAVQLRDAYADVSLDEKKEFRFRFGQSKVPFGFVNLQSSQNRAPFERPDALNSAAEGERDIGAYFIWAPADVRERFKRLVRDGLKGSGDYGVFTLGAYSGQGLNRLDTNDKVHLVSRLSYPFQFANGQIIEPGLQAYAGRFVPRTSKISVGGKDVTPVFKKQGVRDDRVGLSAVLYPQPFGVEAEWNIGRGPALTGDQKTIEEDFLHGGYVQASYKVDKTQWGDWFPFVRWQYFQGARKFARNAPPVRVNEFDFGFEWAPWPEFEVTTMYSFTPTRTESNVHPYNQLTNGHRLGLQLQWNY
jgi:Phosphate-selective porin O and P